MPIDRALEKNWDPQLSEGLPDSRLRMRDNKRIWRANMWWEPVYCASCGGGPHGHVTADWTPHVFYICNTCAEKMQASPPGTVEVPQDEVDKHALMKG